jgi:IrrE N-terminal-like domain
MRGNDAQSEYRQRFTIGHELGHYLLYHHEHFHIDLGPNVQHGDPPGYDWQSERPTSLPLTSLCRQHWCTRPTLRTVRLRSSHSVLKLVSWRWHIGLSSSVHTNAVAYTIRGGSVGKSDRINAY